MSAKVNNNYRELRARLIEKGNTLSSWARAHGYPLTTVYGAARGQRSGVKAIRIRKQLEQLAFKS